MKYHETRLIDIDGEELERIINERYGLELDSVGDGSVPGDDSTGYLEICLESNAPLTEEELNDLKSGEWDTLELGLQDEAARTGMPTGQYRLEFTWG